MKENIITTTPNLSTTTINSKQNAGLEIRSQLFEKCNFIAPLGGCNVQDCLVCNNCDYKIVMSDGTILKDFTYDLNGVREKDIERYTIEFFDKFDFKDEDIVAYLNSKTSNYKITRINDNTILKDTNNNTNNIKSKKAKTLIKGFLIGLKKIYS